MACTQSAPAAALVPMRPLSHAKIPSPIALLPQPILLRLPLGNSHLLFQT